ncbi:MAG: hypothetical protein EYC67_06455 [Betaproteobacteria bacterium]|nr:MAG: hypothetical protein EYC67_06455 [Betaproteobacteria bacterium]
MSMLRLVVGGAALLVSTLVPAQSSNPYDGAWTIKLDAPQAKGLDGRLVIDKDGGTWDVRYMSKRNPCAGKEAPVVVRKATAEELAFDVDFAKVLTGCGVVSYTARPAADGSLHGQSTDGQRTIVLRRE